MDCTESDNAKSWKFSHFVGLAHAAASKMAADVCRLPLVLSHLAVLNLLCIDEGVIRDDEVHSVCM